MATDSTEFTMFGFLLVQPIFAIGGYDGILAGFIAVPLCFVGIAMLIGSLVNWSWNRRAGVACLLIAIALFVIAWMICLFADLDLLAMVTFMFSLADR
jgi:hypothetical protein